MRIGPSVGTGKLLPAAEIVNKKKRAAKATPTRPVTEATPMVCHYEETEDTILDDLEDEVEAALGLLELVARDNARRGRVYEPRETIAGQRHIERLCRHTSVQLFTALDKVQSFRAERRKHADAL